MTVFEQHLALLGQIILSTGAAGATAISDTPRNSVPRRKLIAPFANFYHTANSFVPQNGRGWLLTLPGNGVEVRAADGGQRDFRQHLTLTESFR
jgi:hypothetical protein